MDILTFRDYCLSLPLTEETTPFDETTLVYKIGGRMYASADMAGFRWVAGEGGLGGGARRRGR